MATDPTIGLPRLDIGAQPTVDMTGGTNYTSFFSPESISEQQYLGSGVDFYTQTLGTGIKSTVADEEKPEEKVEDTRPDIFRPIGSDGGDDKQQIASDISRQLTSGLDTTKLFSASELNPQSFSYNDKTGNVDATSYKGGTAGKTVKQKGDLVGDFFSNFVDNLGAINKQTLSKTATSPIDALGFTPTLTTPTGKVGAMGVPLAVTMAMGPMAAGVNILAGISGAANMALAQQTAAKIKAMGGGAFMENSGAMLYRAPGSTMYSGTLVGNSQKMSGYLEAMQRGFVRGTMVIEKFDPATGKMIEDVSGTRDVVSREGLIGSRGGFTETGAWMDLAGNTSYGTVAEQTEAYTAGVNNNFGLSGDYAITKAEIMGLRSKVNTSWSFTKGTHVTPGTKTYQDLVRDLVSEKQKQKESAVDRALGRTTGRGEEDMTKAEIEAEQKAIDKMIADAAKSSGGKDDSAPSTPSGPSFDDDAVGRDSGKDDSSSSGSSADASDDGSGGTAFKSGGRVGYQEGGFAERPEFVGGNQTQPDKVSVADDQPRDVQEGSFVINAAAADFAGRDDIETMIFVINAAAADFAGRDDIETMIRKAYSKAGDAGQSGVSQEVQIAVSKGEVIIPPHIAKIIGYDRLNKINNRGKKEIARRQEAAGGGFIDRKKYAKGDKVVPRSNPQRKKEALADVELRADLEEYMQNDNLARLGFNLYEKGLLDVNAIVLPRRAKEDIEVLTGGMYTPAISSRKVQARRVATGDDREMMDAAQSQGVKLDMRKPSGGISYFVNEAKNYSREDANLILIHELRHAALDYIANTYNIPEDKRLTISREEHLFDAQDYMNRKQARKVKPSIPETYAEPQKQQVSSSAASLASTRKQLQMYQDLAQKVLQDRKVPKRTKSKEVEGFVTRAMGLLDL
jgi:hypothetical protein